jgi:hypothetical protein
MFVVQPIRYRHKLLVPPALARFVPTDQQNRSAPRVEGKPHAVRPVQDWDVGIGQSVKKSC